MLAKILHFPIAVYYRFRSRWLFYCDMCSYTYSDEESSEIENVISDFLFLGLFFVLDQYLMGRCYRKHGDCYVPEDKLKDENIN
jgi:hypothetical protein